MRNDRNFKKFKQSLNFFILICLLIFFSMVAIAPPSPHNVEGRVLTNTSNGVKNGLPVSINDTISGDFTIAYTDAPDVPELMGIYSAAINGSDGDLIIAIAWNSTHYGINSTSLASTTEINIALNITRQSEANVTIIEPGNNSLKNKTIIFNVTANITMLGNDGIDCNATISFSNRQVINISTGENATHALYNITMGNFKIANWSVIGLDVGNSNISVRADCSLDGFKLDKVNSYSVYNITIQNLAPSIRINAISTPIDLIANDNLTLLCNSSITDQNTASDIRNVNATFFQPSAGNNAPDDNNNHYTNNSCRNVSSSEFEANYTCGFKIAYYANNGTWLCNITASDFSNATAFSNNSYSIDELMAIDVAPSIIDYGILKDTNISATDFNVTVRNVGNIAINVTLRAFAPNESLAYLNLSMNCGVGNISNANQRYSAVNGSDFSQMTRLNNETMPVNITLYQRLNDIAFGNDTNMTYWKLQVPTQTLGLCNGTVVFGALAAT